MHYAIIAAGDGARLAAEGILLPKPLVSIGGRPMLGRLLDVVCRCHAESIHVAVNADRTELGDYVRQWVRSSGCEAQVSVVECRTSSSMHSFAMLAEMLPAGRFCLTTVDSIVREVDFARLIDAWEHVDDGMADGLFAVTPYVADEKPLYVTAEEVDGGQLPEITGFYDSLPSQGRVYASGGIYCLDTRTALPVLQRCLDAGQQRMRNYQRALLASGLRLVAWPIAKIVDVDHISDVNEAQAFLARADVLAVRRAVEFSPGRVDDDVAILDAVVSRLREDGRAVRVVDEESFVGIDDAALPDVVVSMGRRPSTLQRLTMCGRRCINDGESVLRVASSRVETIRLLASAGVNLPRWCTLADRQGVQRLLAEARHGVWLKTTSGNGVRPDDVVFLTGEDASTRIASVMESADACRYVAMEHIDGPLVKTYCVMQDDTVVFCHPTCQDVVVAIEHDTAMWQQLSTAIGRATGLVVFGFDAIVDHDGVARVIDVNDWPSFAACRDEAARAIAASVTDCGLPIKPIHI